MLRENIRKYTLVFQKKQFSICEALVIINILYSLRKIFASLRINNLKPMPLTQQDDLEIHHLIRFDRRLGFYH